MKSNKLAITAAMLATVGSSNLLSGCVAPGNNDQEQHQDSSFNIYPDNRVIFETFLNGYPNYYAWTRNDGDVIVFKIKNHKYNAKDISSISFAPNKTSSASVVTIRLKSGEIISDTVATYTEKNPVGWLVCKDKHCPTGKYYDYVEGLLKGIYVRDIENPREIKINQVTFSWNPRYHIMSDSRVIPSVRDGVEEIRFLDDSKRVAIENRISSLEKSYDDADNKRREDERKNEAERENRITSEAADLRKHVRIGSMTNCGQVFDVRLPMVGVQTMVGSQYIDISRLYGPSATCRFVNGQYIGR